MLSRVSPHWDALWILERDMCSATFALEATTNSRSPAAWIASICSAGTRRIDFILEYVCCVLCVVCYAFVVSSSPCV